MQSNHTDAFGTPQGADEPFKLFLRPSVTALAPPDISLFPTDREVGVLCVLDLADLLKTKPVADVRASTSHQAVTGLESLVTDFIKDLPLEWRRYLRNVLDVTGVATYLEPIIGTNSAFRFCIHVHYYHNRPLASINVHHDSIGRTLFVGLHYLVDKPVVGAEWAFHWTEFNNRKSPLDDDLDVWPLTIRNDVVKARALIQVSNRWHAAKIPAQGLLFFTDELIHHKTPSPSRKRLDPGSAQLLNAAFASVEIVDAQALTRQVIDYNTADYDRDVSDDDEDLQVAQANTFTTNATRSFLRFWITVQPQREPVYW